MISFVFPDAGFYDSSAIATRVGTKTQVRSQAMQPKRKELEKLLGCEREEGGRDEGRDRGKEIFINIFL